MGTDRDLQLQMQNFEALLNEAPLPVPATMCIVAADDNPDVLFSMALLLRMNGYAVETAVDGMEALEQVRTHQPAVAILDIGMPGMDGYEVARRIRQAPWGRHVMLVALTGWGRTSDQQQALEAGFDVHLTKPVQIEMLEQLLVKHFAVS